SASKDAPIGGQAVLEGVMMRGVSTWAVAVRKPPKENLPDESDNGAVATIAPAAGLEGVVIASHEVADVDPATAPLGEIETHTERFVSWIKKRRAFRLPIVRGVVALAESLKIGFRALGIAANAQLGDTEEELSGRAWGVTIGISLLFAVGLFFVLPVTIANFWKDSLGSSVLFVVVEKLIRITIFLAYLWLISRLRDLRRVFEYHGAEHKVIACYEAGDELVPERAQLYSRLHVRCGTSFLLIVMILAIFVFAPIGLPAWWILVLTRILGVPVIAGLSFEVIKWAGRNRRRRWVQWIMWPGMQLQKLTTREPDLDELAVSIASLQAVLAVETPGEASAEDLIGLEVVA